MGSLGGCPFASYVQPGRITTEPDQPAPGHAARNLPPLPPGSDLSKLPLAFQYVEANRSSGASPDTEADIVLLAGSYRLGHLQFTDMWATVCDRSPDGKRLAFWADGFIKMVDLEDLLTVKSVQASSSPYDLAIAPDNRRIAFFNDQNRSGVFVWDADAWQVKMVLEAYQVNSLVWSPDGRYLAMVAGLMDTEGVSLVVAQVQLPQVIYQHALPYTSFWQMLDFDWRTHLSGDWPVSQWGVSFPQLRYGIQSCSPAP